MAENTVAVTKEEDKSTEDKETKATEKTDKNDKAAKKAGKNDKEEKKADKEDAKDDDGEEEEDLNIEDLFASRKSIPMNPNNAKFARSAGDLISLDLINDEGEEEHFERVIVLRSFPISNPDEFLSIREPDTRKKGRGKEIGMIRRISEFDAETAKLLNAELDLRYFSPVIQKISSVKEKFGYSYWETETSAGDVVFVLDNPFSNIRILEDGRIFIADMDGNTFVIPDPTKLDKNSYKRIEVYI
jgi:Domain of unknown function (DUF1854).